MKVPHTPGANRGARFAAGVVIAFMLLYNLSFLAAPSVTSGRVAVIVLLVCLGRPLLGDLWTLVRRSPWFAVALTATVGWAFLLWVAGPDRDTTQLSRLIHFVGLSVLGALGLARLMGFELRGFLGVVAIAVLSQSGLIGLSYVSAGFRLAVSELLVAGGHIDILSSLQVAGFSNSSGAALSVVQSLGVFCAAYLANLATATGAGLGWLGTALVITLSTVVVGRTGMLLSLAFVMAIGIPWAHWRRIAPVAAVLATAAAIAYLTPAWARERLEAVNPVLWDTLDRASSALTGLRDDPSVLELVERPVPPISLSTVVGVGTVTDGVSNTSGHDSGYVQTYYALGLIMAILFYGAFLVWAVRLLWPQAVRWPVALLIASMFVAELKEPFIFKYSLPMVAIGLLVIGARRPEASHVACRSACRASASSARGTRAAGGRPAARSAAADRQPDAVGLPELH